MWKFVFLFIVPTLSAQVAKAPNMMKICAEGCYITAAPAATVFQFGTGSTWEPTFTLANHPLPIFASYTILGDPANGVVKEIDAQETTTAYSVTYTATKGGMATTVLIPAISVTSSGTFPLPMSGTKSCTLSWIATATGGITFTFNCP